jgi:hypothetical protein
MFILWPLCGVLTSEHWSFVYERWLGSACVGVLTGWLQAVVYNYSLLFLPCGVVCFALWEVATLELVTRFIGLYQL